MNFKKTWKRFFSLSRRNDGFTLVELIVVIAILAILAGVAVPAYNGYIEKANESHDIQLLADINTAFAAACMNNGEDPYKLAGTPEAKLTEKKFDGTITYSEDQGIEDSFKLFYDLGEVEFKVFEKLFYHAAVGGFANDSVITVTYRGTTITVSQSDIQPLINSTWGEIGAEDLLGLVSSVTGLAQSIDNEVYKNMIGGENFAAVASEIFGDDYLSVIGSLTMSEFQKWYDENPNATVDEQNAKRAEIGSSITANTAVLVAAKNAKAASTDIMSILASGNAKETIKTTMSNPGTAATGLSQAALAYGMYSSYMYSTGKADPANGALEPTDVMNALSKDNKDFANFEAYLNSPQGKQDMEGYLAALNTVNSNSNVATDVVVNGFSDEQLVGLLGSIMG